MLSKRKAPIKASYQYLIRAKLYGVITMNAIEGMMNELDELIPVEMERDNIDAFSEELRRYQNGSIMPTSHGDYLDRAVSSLAKEMNLAVPVELSNSMAIHQLVTSIIVLSTGEDRRHYLEWLEQPNELITKSVRFEQLVNNTCVYFYKKPMSAVTEDTVNFIRRSIHDMLKNKTTKDQIHSKLLANPQQIMTHEQPMPSYEYVPDNNNIFIPQVSEQDRVLHGINDLSQMRQGVDPSILLMNQPPALPRNGDNVSL